MRAEFDRSRVGSNGTAESFLTMFTKKICSLMKIEQNAQKLLSKREFFGYAFGFIGPITLLSLVGTLQNLYYVYVIGLDALFSGVGLFIGLLTYAFFSLVWGNASDNATGRFARRYGKRRLFMAIALFPMVVTFILQWMPPIKPSVMGEENGAVAAWLWMTSFLFHFFFAMFSAPYWALMPEITTNEDERLRLSIAQNLANLVGTVVSILVPILLLSNAKWDQSLFWAAGVTGMSIIVQMALYSLVFIIITLISITLTLATVREPPIPVSAARRGSFGIFFRSIFKPLKENPDFKIWQGANFMINLAARVLLLDIMIFIRNVLKLEGGEWFIFLVVIIPVGKGAFAFFDKLKKKIGLKRSFLDGILMAAIVLLSALIFFLEFPKNLSFGLGLAFISIGIVSLVGMLIFPTPVNSALVDKGCVLAACERTELSGKYSGIYLFFLYLSSALASLLYSSILDALGAENRIAIVLALPISGACILVGFFLFRRVDLSSPQRGK